MSPSRTVTTGRAIVEEVLGRDMTREIWSGNYEKALPLSVQSFDLSAVLPAVFYMFRFGYRRGKGKFIEAFGSSTGTPRERRQGATVERVGRKLSENNKFLGFNGEAEQAILGDLLLCFCLENAKHALGRKEQVQRVAPAHYMASWVDLPDSVVHLRYVPEMIVAMLANQKDEYIQQNHEGDRTRFAVGRGFENNVLLRAFHQGVMRRDEQGSLANRTSDRFEEGTSVGVDQLLMIRLAEQLGAAPDKLRGSEGELISNQRPIAEKAARDFSEDIRRFVRSYADVLPRHAFVELLESCIAVGMTTILTSVMRDVPVIGTRKRREIRSLVFTDSVLDYLVHLHVLPSGNRSGVRPLSFKEFIRKLHDRYGFCVDVAPPGMTISNDLLQANRAILERRLRDLGLLVGVNDAEAMKRLRPRFEPTTEDEHGMD